MLVYQSVSQVAIALEKVSFDLEGLHKVEIHTALRYRCQVTLKLWDIISYSLSS